MSDTDTPEIDRETLVAGYIRFAEALGRGVPDDTAETEAASDAYSAVEQIITHGPAGLAWDLVVEILRRAPDDRLDVYGVGPLEDLVRLHGVELVDVIEREAARDERFRWALGCVWLTVGELPARTMTRIVRASDGEIRPLDLSAIPPHRDRAT